MQVFDLIITWQREGSLEDGAQDRQSQDEGQWEENLEMPLESAGQGRGHLQQGLCSSQATELLGRGKPQ